MTFPRKLFCGLVCAGCLALPERASALDTTLTYDAFIDHDQRPIPVGQLQFELGADLPFTACQYTYEWDNAASPSGAPGAVDETKTLANRSCIENSLTPFSTFLQLDSALGPSFGFDTSQAFRQVSALVVGETSAGVLSGTVQFTAAAPVVESIVIQPEGASAPPPPPPSPKPKPKH
jgi:hypothetical protein